MAAAFLLDVGALLSTSFAPQLAWTTEIYTVCSVPSHTWPCCASHSTGVPASVQSLIMPLGTGLGPVEITSDHMHDHVHGSHLALGFTELIFAPQGGDRLQVLQLSAARLEACADASTGRCSSRLPHHERHL